MFDYAAIQQMVDSVLLNWGRPSGQTIIPLKIRRDTVDRPVTGVIIDYTPRERAGGLFEDYDRRALISPVSPTGGLIVAPDNQQDELVIPPSQSNPEEVVCKFVHPIGRIEPAGFVLLYDGTVRDVRYV